MRVEIRCDFCGRFVSSADLESGRATRELLTPDSEVSHEEYKTLCEKDKNKMTPKKGVSKNCGLCREVKPLESFYRDRTHSNGRDTYCKSCISKRGGASIRLKHWRKRNPAKARAHLRVKRAIRKGLLVRPPRCSACQCEAKVWAHHDDYSKPLDVRWLCTRCHVLHHHPEKAAA